MNLLHFAKRPAATLAAFSLVLVAACSDSTAPDAPFDPAGMSQDVATAGAAFESDLVASFNGLSEAMGAAVDGSVSTSIAAAPSSALTSRERAARLLNKVRANLSVRGTKPSFASSIPPEYAGKTFEYNPETGKYFPGDRQGAPSNGVRFLLYAVDLTGEPTAELDEIGYVELTASESGTTSTARIKVVSTENVTHLDYTATATSSSSALSIAINGFVSNGTDRADFKVSLVFTNTSGTISYLLTTSAGFSISAKLTVSDFETLDATVTLEAKGPHGRVTITGTQTDAGETYTVKVNGDPFAKITVNSTGSVITITDPNGEPLSEEERNTLEHVMSIFAGGLLFFGGLLTPGF